MIEKIQWMKKYELGIDEIDLQHEYLFELANSVCLLHDDNTKENIRELLHEFHDYTLIHFKDEEAYMKSINFPELEYHKKLHENIVETLNNVIKESGSIANIKQKMKEVVKTVLIEHIVDDDMKIKLFEEQDLSIIIDDIENEYVM